MRQLSLPKLRRKDLHPRHPEKKFHRLAEASESDLREEGIPISFLKENLGVTDQSGLVMLKMEHEEYAQKIKDQAAAIEKLKREKEQVKEGQRDAITKLQADVATAQFETSKAQEETVK